jgi:DMSO reductase anchor subunit
LLLGGLLTVLVLKLKTPLQGAGHDTMGLQEYRIIAFAAVMMGFLLKMLAAAKSPSAVSPSGQEKIHLPLMQGCGIALWVVSISSDGGLGVQSVLLFLAALSLVAGEIVQRIHFYDSYQRVGL